MDKIAKIILVFSFIISQNYGVELKCEDEGCYEVIKTFVKILEEKINETDKILAEATKELNEVTLGNDTKFENRILELDNRLNKLINEMTTGIEGGDLSLFDLINTVFKEVNQAEMNSNQIELALDNGNKIIKIAEIDYSDISEVIRKVQEEFDKLKNQTEVDMPNALQDAFDRSENLHSDTKELRDILGSMKSLLADYERNLLNAKDLTSQTLNKLKDASEQMNTTSKVQKEIQDTLKDENESKLPVHELENVKKLTKSAQEKAKTVFDDSLELLNEVSLLELYGKLSDIEKKIKELDDYSKNGEADLKKFTDENSKFIDEMKATLDKADALQKKAIAQQNSIEELLKEVQGYENMAKKAIEDQDETVSNARNIHKTLEDFSMKVEETREKARIVMEKIPEIKKKITDSTEIVKNLEDKAEESMSTAMDARDKCLASKTEMEEILTQTSDMKDAISNIGEQIDQNYAERTKVLKENELNEKNHANLKKAENETEDMIQSVKEKVDRTKSKEQEVAEKVDAALKNVEDIMKQVDGMKDVDEKELEEFEIKLNELENSLKTSEFLEKLKVLMEKQRHQDELFESYRVELAFLEHEVKTIKENADSLENRCFKRTRLEP